MKFSVLTFPTAPCHAMRRQVKGTPMPCPAPCDSTGVLHPALYSVDFQGCCEHWLSASQEALFCAIRCYAQPLTHGDWM
jgi:hypothetical protein